MGAGWVAGSVRARLLANHCLGPDAARELAGLPTFDDALSTLRASSYGDGFDRVGSTAAAQRAVWATVVWDLRVLAGWLPPVGVAAMRVFAGWFEIENVEDELVGPERTDRPSLYDVGSLATIRQRGSDAASVQELTARLRGAPWFVSSAADPASILTSMRIAWARRLGEIPPARAWGLGAVALAAARVMADGNWPESAHLGTRLPAVGRRIADATNLVQLAIALPEQARWVLEGCRDTSDLWRAETAWWRRLDADGAALLRASQPGLDVVVGAIARRMVDAWRAAGALEVVARAGRGWELIDAVA